MQDLIGKQIGPYQIDAFIGRGGMATVYRAYQVGLDRHVALKILAPEIGTEEDFLGRFQQEARVVASLQHPHILAAFDAGRQDGYVYLAMPYIATGTLADRLLDDPLPPRKFANFISQIANALDYAHNKGLVHRDIKPSNVLVDEGDNCLLTDFGIARVMAATSHFTRTGNIIGTPTYMSPEQGLGSELDHRSDVYSLGVILYEMATGSVPFDSDTPISTVFKHIHEPLPPPGELNPSLTQPVEWVIYRSLAKSPDDRYQTAGALAHDLQLATTNPTAAVTILERPPSQTVPIQPPVSPPGPPAGPPAGPSLAEPPPENGHPSRAIPLIAIIAFLLLGVAAITYFMLQPGKTGTANRSDSGNSLVFETQDARTPQPVVVVVTATANPDQPVATDAPVVEPTDVPATTPAPPTEPLEPTATPTTTPTATPDGNPHGRLAFVSDRTGKDELYLLDLDTDAVRTLTSAPGARGRDWWPAWCGSNQILFERADDHWDPGWQEIAAIDVATGSERTITSSSMPDGSEMNGIPSCSPDGDLLALTSLNVRWNLGLVDIGSANPRFRLVSDGYAIGGNVSWSPDGRAIVFMHYKSDDRNFQIYRVELDNPASFIDLSSAFGGNNKYPAWSPDGRYVAFACSTGTGTNRTWSLCLTDADRANVTTLLSTVHFGPERYDDIELVRHAVTPSWSPDSRWIAYASDQDGDWDIYVYSVETGDTINVTNRSLSDEIHPSWGS